MSQPNLYSSGYAPPTFAQGASGGVFPSISSGITTGSYVASSRGGYYTDSPPPTKDPFIEAVREIAEKADKMNQTAFDLACDPNVPLTRCGDIVETIEMHEIGKQRAFGTAALKWTGSALQLGGAIIVALHLSWSGLAFPFMLMGSLIWTGLAVVSKEWALAAMEGAFSGANLLGAVRWLL